MSGSLRDLAAADLWANSLVRSRARRRGIVDGEPLATRDLSDVEHCRHSLERSLTRRRAAQLQFVPPRSRARRASLGALAALTAAPLTAATDAGAATARGSSSSSDPTTSEHTAVLTTGSRGAAVVALQRRLGVP